MNPLLENLSENVVEFPQGDFLLRDSQTENAQVCLLFEGALCELKKVVDQFSAKNIFLVLDETAYIASGASAELEQLFSQYRVTIFKEFASNPKLEDVLTGLQKFKQSKQEIIIAFGGGTAIDLAKMIGAFASHKEDPKLLATGEIPLTQKGLPVIAIPTTAGTGSEATHFAVVYLDGKKYSVVAPFLIPEVAIIDPLLTRCLPKEITLATGLDAFCQAIESVWAVKANDQSLAYALQAIDLLLINLPQVIQQPNSQNRIAMGQASYLAGKAINISQTTLPHALSYTITSRYGIAHGEAVAMTLSGTLAFNFGVNEKNCIDPRGHKHVQQRLNLILQKLDVADSQTACTHLNHFLKSLGAAASLQEARIVSEEEIRILADEVNLQRLSNNPRQASKEDLINILGDLSLNCNK